MITVTDNHGTKYVARYLLPGDTYGNGAVWGEVFYQQGRIGITIDGLPCTYFADQFADKAEGRRIGGQLAIDYGQGWTLTEESTLAFFQLADKALTLAGLR